MADDRPQAFPLQWPVGWKRTHPSSRSYARFRTHGGRITMTDALQRLYAEFKTWGIHDVTISSNVQPTLRGVPAANVRVADPGVAVYFRLRAGGRPKVFACDRWMLVEENIAAVAGHIHALRAVERYGVGETEQVLAGYTALPISATNWRQMMGFKPDAVPGFDQVEIEYKKLIKLIRAEAPSGNDPREARLNEARDLARMELQGR